MKIEDSNLADFIEDIHISDNGTYYFFENFIIAEINEGVTYTWDSAQDVIKAVLEHYGENPSVSYITNRVNKYEVRPSHWLKFFKNSYFINGYAIVSYTERGWINAILEKFFLSTKVEYFSNLYEAVEWAKKLPNNKNKTNSFLSF